MWSPTLDQLASATGNTIDVQSVLQLLGAVEEDALFRLCDAIVDRDTGGALIFLEELAEQGQDLGRLVTDLLQHLRHLLLVQHMGHVPDSLPVTDETRERLREQANSTGPHRRCCGCATCWPSPSRIRGRVPIPGFRLSSRWSRSRTRPRILTRVARIPGRPARAASRRWTCPRGHPRCRHHRRQRRRKRRHPWRHSRPRPPPASETPPLALEQLQDAWQRTVLPAVQSRSIPVASLLGEARPGSPPGRDADA